MKHDLVLTSNSNMPCVQDRTRFLSTLKALVERLQIRVEIQEKLHELGEGGGEDYDYSLWTGNLHQLVNVLVEVGDHVNGHRDGLEAAINKRRKY